DVPIVGGRRTTVPERARWPRRCRGRPRTRTAPWWPPTCVVDLRLLDPSRKTIRRATPSAARSQTVKIASAGRLSVRRCGADRLFSSQQNVRGVERRPAIGSDEPPAPGEVAEDRLVAEAVMQEHFGRD